MATLTEKIDVLDLLIATLFGYEKEQSQIIQVLKEQSKIVQTLKEHEENLDKLIVRLNMLKIEKIEELKIEELKGVVPVSGMLRTTGNSIALRVPRDIAAAHGLKAGDHVLAYIRKAV